MEILLFSTLFIALIIPTEAYPVSYFLRFQSIGILPLCSSNSNMLFFICVRLYRFQLTLASFF